MTIVPEIPQGALSVLYDVGVVARLTGTILDDALEDAGIAANEFFMTSVLMVHGPLTPTDVANRSGVPPSTVSKVISRLVERDLVVEEIHPTDRRSRLIRLSVRGRRAHTDAQEGFGKVLAGIFGLLGSEMADTVWSLRRLEWALREIGPWAPIDGDNARVAAPHWIRYSGNPLTVDEVDEVLRFIDWIVHRRTQDEAS